MLTPLQPQTLGETLFPGSPCYTPGPAQEHGFYHLEQPHGMRWIQPEAQCRLPRAGRTPRRPAILIRAVPGSFYQWIPYLTVLVDGEFVDTQAIATYDTYYFELDPQRHALDEELALTLRVNHAQQEPGGPRRLALAVYEIQLVDLDDDNDRFTERELCREQLSAFAPGSVLSQTLERLALGSESVILDVGAGMGWSTVLLALRAPGRVLAVDPYPYDAATGAPFKADLRRRWLRQRTLLAQTPAFSAQADPAILDEAIARCSFFCMPAEQMLLRDGLADFVFSLNAFEHIADPVAALAEIARLLRPGGEAVLIFNPLYYSDQGHHLMAVDLYDQPWIHLLHTREEIKQLVESRGRASNEVDTILDTLNGWTARQFAELFENGPLQVVSHHAWRGFADPAAKHSPAFKLVRARFPLEDLTTVGMEVHLRKI